MALQLASALDGVSFSEPVAKRMESVINNALSEVTVSKGYNVLVSIAGRSYSLTSGKDGKLVLAKVTPGAATTKAVAECKVRWLIDPTAIVDPDSEDASDILMDKRKMQIEGDGSMLSLLSDELSEQVESILAQASGIKVSGKAMESQEKAVELFKATLDQDYSVTQLAYLSKDVQDPPLMKLGGWILFTAVSVMFGNAGQSNYTAANIILDALGYTNRMSAYNTFNAIALGWGTVGGLGMRWKAFASQDMMLANEQTASLMMTWDQALGVLKAVIADNVCGEVIYNNHFGDAAARAGLTTMFRNPEPWGKGKGGGLDLSEAEQASPDVEYTHASRIGEQKTDRKKPRGWLFQGRRVKVHGLEANKEMNGIKGTLIEEVDGDKWQVKLDDDLGDKIIKVQNLMTLSGTVVRSSNKGVSLPPADMYSIAGSWDEFMPHDMQWDSQQGCYVFSVEGQVSFKIFKDAASKQVVSKAQLWSINQDGKYQVRVSLSGGAIKKVDWVRVCTTVEQGQEVENA